MGAHITRRLFRRRDRAFAIGLVLLMATGIAAATADPAAQRFRVQATISPAPSTQFDTRFGLDASVSPMPRGAAAGAGYTLNASVASPSVCTDDTIFINGFDP